MMMWLKMGDGGMGGAKNGAGQSQQLWHGLGKGFWMTSCLPP